MNHATNKNLDEIKKFYKKRLIKISALDKKSFKLEFNEWIKDSFSGSEYIWTLPDLTRVDRLENFCRSIKKKIK